MYKSFWDLFFMVPIVIMIEVRLYNFELLLILIFLKTMISKVIK